MSEQLKEVRLAVLIDAENISPTVIKQVLIRLQAHKGLTLKRAYGDWSKPHLNSWRSTIVEWGIHPVYAPTYTTSKNSADMALTIDALDLLHDQKMTWFCIVSNDSDFTPLVHRLIKSGAKVIGFGSNQASRAFVNACHKFISLEAHQLPAQLQNAAGADASVATPPLQLVPKTADSLLVTTASQATITKEQLGDALQRIFSSLSAKNDWVSLNQIHTNLQKRYVNFSCKRFGYSSLVKLIEGTQLFELRQQRSNPTNPKQMIIEIRLKRAA